MRFPWWWLVSAALGCERAAPQPPPPAAVSSAPAAPAPALASAPAAIPKSAPAAPREVSATRLARLVESARETASSALVVIQDGEVLGEWSFSDNRAPIQTMSITKSVLALLVGCLVDRDELAPSTPVVAHFPEWKGERQAKVTVAHLLAHTSGIEEGERTSDIYASESFVRHALEKPIVHEPGTHYEYGNRASNLLSGVIARAAGKPTDALARECLFEPLGIRRFSWSHDRAGAAHGLAGLHLLPRDLAKLGELVLAGGSWMGRRVISADWIRRVTEEPAPVQPAHRRLSGLWWLLPAQTERTITDATIARWREHEVDPELISKLEPLRGRRFHSALDFIRALRERTGDPKLSAVERELWKQKVPDAEYAFGPIAGSYAQGSLGQYLVVVPEHRLVAVRMRRADAQRDDIERSFPDFPDRVLALVGASAPK